MYKLTYLNWPAKRVLGKNSCWISTDIVWRELSEASFLKVTVDCVGSILCSNLLGEWTKGNLQKLPPKKWGWGGGKIQC